MSLALCAVVCAGTATLLPAVPADATAPPAQPSAVGSSLAAGAADAGTSVTVPASAGDSSEPTDQLAPDEPSLWGSPTGTAVLLAVEAATLGALVALAVRIWTRSVHRD